MLGFDLRTTFLLGIFIDSIAFIIILSLWHQNRQRYPGLTYWLAGYATQVVSQILVGLRNIIPDFFSMVFGNTLIILSFILVLTGLERFLRKPGHNFRKYLLVATIFGALIYATLVQSNFETRVIIISTGMMLVGLQCIWLVARRSPHGSLVPRQLIMTFSAMALVSLIRAILPVFMDYGQDLFEANNVDATLIVLLQMLFLFLTYDLVLMVNQRLHMDTLKREEALREAQAFSNNVLSSAPNPILVTNLDSIIEYVNPAFEELTGYRATELIGQKPPFPWWPTELEEQYYAENISGMKPDNGHFERRYLTKDGNEIWVEVNLKAIKEAGETKYYLKNWVDITERKATSDKIQELYQKEKAAHAELEEEAQARGLFIDILAHELKTPLTPMLNSSESLKELLQTEPNSLESMLIDNIHRSTQIMARRLEELLEVARYTRGIFQLNTETVDLKQFLNDVINRFKPTLGSNGQQLVIRIPDDMPPATIDISRIEQVIINLLSNAVKYSPEKGAVEFRVCVEDSTLRIEVRDEGTGITTEEQKNLFKPYHRARQDQRMPGLGLGLAISKQIVNAHGGDIWVETRPGQGSTFSFTIPLAPEEQAQET